MLLTFALDTGYILSICIAEGLPDERAMLWDDCDTLPNRSTPMLLEEDRIFDEISLQNRAIDTGLSKPDFEPVSVI